MKAMLLSKLILSFLLLSCGSSNKKEFTSYKDDKRYEHFQSPVSEAHYSSYGADGFNIYTPAPQRPDPRLLEFYYKFCTGTDEPSYFSESSYVCDDLNKDK